MSLSKHIHLLFFTIVFLLVMGGCDNFLNNPEEKTTFPKTGQTPLPDIAGTSYQSEITSDPKGDHHTLSSSNAPEIEWDVVKPLLKKAQRQTDSRYAAVYSVRKNSEGRYHYETAPLEFSPKALEEAGDAIQPYFFQSAKSLDSPLQLLVAYIPDSQKAKEEMKQWILSKRKAGTVVKNPNSKKSNKTDKTLGQCFVTDTYYVFDTQGNLIHIVAVGHYIECVDSAEGGDTGGDVPCSVQLIPTDDCPGSSDPCPYNCGGNGGSGNGSDNEVTSEFQGEITVDETITRNDLTDCVYGKLEQSNQFAGLIAQFEGGNSTFDITFKLTETDRNSYGALTGTPPNFVAEIDASWVTIRNGIEVASTFLHEAMHAEMRRYLYDQEQNGSTIPGFPGSFTEDWDNYVAEKFGEDPDDIAPAEHQAMAEYFIGFIADGLQEFDNNQLDRKHYEALAWDGLINTDAWDNADQNQISQYRHDEAIDSRPIQCSR